MAPTGSYILVLMPPGSGIVWEGSEGVAFLEWVWLIGGGVSLRVDFKVSKAQARPSVSLCLLPADHAVKPSATALAARQSASCHEDNGLTLQNSMQALIEMLSFIGVALVMASSHRIEW